MLLHVADDDLFALARRLQDALRARAPGETLWFTAPDPDRRGLYEGEPTPDGRHRSLAGWVMLAEELGATLLTPQPAGPGRVRLGLRRLDRDASWQTRAAPSGDPEKYGADSDFARIRKFEEPPFLFAFARALDFVDPADGARVLALGCNRGDELDALCRLRSDRTFECHGIDHAASAIERARTLHPTMTFLTADLQRLDAPPLAEMGRFDLILALNVLHSPSLDGKAILQRLVAEHLTPAGAVIVGLPNVRYVDHTLHHGARVKGFSHPELSVLVRDAAYYRRYLARHKFRVMITGRHTLLICARPLPGRRG